MSSSSPSKKSPQSRRKVKNFEWTDSLINQFTYDVVDDGSAGTLASYASSSEQITADGSAPTKKVWNAPKKVARSKSDRDDKKKAEDPALELRRRQIAEGELKWALTELMGDWLASAEGALVSKHTPMLPLQFFDDNELRAAIALEWERATAAGEAAGDTPQSAVALFTATSDADAGGAAALGQWQDCMVTSFEPSAQVCEVQWMEGGGVVSLHPMQVCFAWHGRHAFVKRFQAALARRRACESLLRYQYIVSCMPVDPSIVATLGSEQSSRILALALVHLTGESGARMGGAATGLLEEVTHEYETAMNQLIFDSNMLNVANYKAYLEMALPPPPPRVPVPRVGVISTPPHDFKAALAQFSSGTFLTSDEAIHAALGVVSTGLEVTKTRMLSTAHDVSLSSDKFSNVQAQAMNQALRVVKDEWPQRTAANIRQALASADRARYNTEEGVMNKYKAEGNMLRLLLIRVNYTMTDTLFDITRASLEAYTKYILANCEASVHVAAVDNVEVQYPDVPAAKRVPRPPPLFQISIKRTDEKLVTNQARTRDAAPTHVSAPYPTHVVGASSVFRARRGRSTHARPRFVSGGIAMLRRPTTPNARCSRSSPLWATCSRMTRRRRSSSRSRARCSTRASRTSSPCLTCSGT